MQRYWVLFGFCKRWKPKFSLETVTVFVFAPPFEFTTFSIKASLLQTDKDDVFEANFGVFWLRVRYLFPVALSKYSL